MTSNYSLTTAAGARKYLTAEERERFAAAIDDALAGPRDREKRTLAQMYYLTGCRRNEALGVRYCDIDNGEGGVRFATLKRRQTVYRFVPLPEAFLTRLDDIHRIRDEQRSLRKARPEERVWPVHPATAGRVVDKVMRQAGIEGKHATPKGLRHAFVIAHIMVGSPEHMIAQWAGWSTAQMMQVYGKTVRREERELASKVWG